MLASPFQSFFFIVRFVTQTTNKQSIDKFWHDDSFSTYERLLDLHEYLLPIDDSTKLNIV